MKTRFAALAALSMLTAACVPTTSHQGFQVLDVKPDEVKVGEDTKSTVLERLGSPTLVSTFDPNVWYYVSQRSQLYTFHRPRVIDRDAVAISFDAAEKVAKIEEYDLDDAKSIAYARRETPTRGRELSILEQLLGNVGRQRLPNDEQEEEVPGRRRERDR